MRRIALALTLLLALPLAAADRVERLAKLADVWATAKYLDPIGLHALAGMSYLVPLGVIFILMVIFMPQGLLGFARRWLNR